MLPQGLPYPLFSLKWKFLKNAETLGLDWLREGSQIIAEQVLFCKLRTFVSEFTFAAIHLYSVWWEPKSSKLSGWSNL